MFGLSFVLFVFKMSAGKDFVFNLVMDTETGIKNSKSFENRLYNFLCFQINVYLFGTFIFY